MPKAAELVAGTLRRRIIHREYALGELLPSEGELMGDFDVARTTVRDAIRILESEGLLEVRRGGGGGARVRAPGVGMLASYAAVLLQFEGASLADVHLGRLLVEPRAAAILASRHREPALIATLRAALEGEAAASDDARALTLAEGNFHRLVVELTGNHALVMLSAVTNRLIAQQIARSLDHREAIADEGFAEAHRAHVRLVELIESGDEVAAEAEWGRHLRSATEHLARAPAATVIDLLP